MTLIDRIASRIAKQRMCVRAFPCANCDGMKDPFEGAGCRVVAFAALSALTPDPVVNEDDDKRAEEIEYEVGRAASAALVVEIVDRWITKALLDDD